MDGKGRWIDSVFVERLWRFCEVRGALLVRIRQWARGPALALEVPRGLQRPTPSREPRLRHARRGVLRCPDRPCAGSCLRNKHSHPASHQLDFGGYGGSAPLAIAAPQTLYMVAFFRRQKNALTPAFSRPSGVRLRCGEDIDEDRRGRDHHHQPLGQIHLSGEEVCSKKRSHPWYYPSYS